MTESRIPLDVAEFLRDQIPTYEQLELMVRLGRKPTTEQGVSSLIKDLNMDPRAGAAVVDQLEAAGLLTVTHDAAGDRVRCVDSAGSWRSC